MTVPDVVIFFASALAGGAINAVAGGGTFLTFPVLMMGGLTSIEANATSTIALWPGSLAGAVAYRGALAQSRREIAPLALVSLAGSALGAAALLLTPETAFRAFVPWLLLAATLIFTFGKQLPAFAIFARPAIRPEQVPETGGLKVFFLQFIIAFYGGYFGAGIGILMLAMLQCMGMTGIHRMNALKTILGSAINAVAALTFAVAGIVVWPVALVMIAGAVAGGYLGARMALRLHPAHVRFFVIMTGFAMTAYFFFAA